MLLRKIILLTALAMSIGLTSCSESTDTSYDGINYMMLTLGNITSIREDSDDKITVNILLSKPVTSDVTINFGLDGNENDILKLEGNPVTIQGGTKTGSFSIVSNNKDELKNNKNFSIKVNDFGAQKMALLDKKPIVFTVKPSLDSSIQLSEELLAVIDEYNQKNNVNLYRALGELKCTVVLSFSEDNFNYYVNDTEETSLTVEGKTIVTLNENSTASSIMLKMTDNPMGMNDLLYSVLKKETFEDIYECWNGDTYYEPLINAINYNSTTETFRTELDSIVVEGSNLNFVRQRSGYATQEEHYVVPFNYTYSAWDRLLEKANNGESVEVPEGDNTVLTPLSTLIEQGKSLDPYDYLFTSDVNEDVWEEDFSGEPTLWVKPSGMIDFEKGIMTFDFSFSNAQASGYTKVHVVINLKE